MLPSEEVALLSAEEVHHRNIEAMSAATAKKRKTDNTPVAVSSPNGSISSSSSSSASATSSAAVPNQFSARALEGLEEANEETEAGEGNGEDSNFETDDRFDPHGAEFDEAAQQYSIHQRVIHFLHPHHISSVTRASVERALLIEAGTIVTDCKTMDKDSRSTLMVETYHELVKGFDFDSHHFHPKSLQTTMLSKLYQAKSDISGKQLWETDRSSTAILSHSSRRSMPLE